MILGNVCTRACAFCNVATGRPDKIDPHEPEHVAQAAAAMGLAHIVITSVDRDDLEDGGAGHFVEVIKAIRARTPATTIEVLTPDFLKKDGAARGGRPRAARCLQPQPRDRAAALCVDPAGSALLQLAAPRPDDVKKAEPGLFTKVGHHGRPGRDARGVLQVMDDLRAADVFLTIGQYLQPTPKRNHALELSLAKAAYAKGFLMVSSSP